MGGASSTEDVIRAAVRGAELGAARGRATPGPSVARRIECAVGLALAGGDEATVATAETVPSALAVFAYTDGDPMKTALLAANLGGDCDTVGAIACSVAGAFAGVSAFPADAIGLIEQVNKLGLKELARDLLELLPPHGYRHARLKTLPPPPPV